DDYQSRRTVSRSIQRDSGVSNHLNLTDAERHQCFAHALAQLASTRSRKPDLRSDQITAPELRSRTRAIDRFAHGSGGSCNSYSQRVRGSGAALADYSLARVHDNGFGLGPAAVDTNH